MGEAAARDFGLAEASTEVKDSVDGLVAKVCTTCLSCCGVSAEARGLPCFSSIKLLARVFRVNFCPLMKLYLRGSILDLVQTVVEP